MYLLIKDKEKAKEILKSNINHEKIYGVNSRFAALAKRYPEVFEYVVEKKEENVEKKVVKRNRKNRDFKIKDKMLDKKE